MSLLDTTSCYMHKNSLKIEIIYEKNSVLFMYHEHCTLLCLLLSTRVGDFHFMYMYVGVSIIKNQQKY